MGTAGRSVLLGVVCFYCTYLCSHLCKIMFWVLMWWCLLYVLFYCILLYAAAVPARSHGKEMLNLHETNPV